MDHSGPTNVLYKIDVANGTIVYKFDLPKEAIVFGFAQHENLICSNGDIYKLSDSIPSLIYKFEWE